MGVADRIEHEVQRMRLISRKRRELKKISDSRRQKMIAEVDLTDEQKAEMIYNRIIGFLFFVG